jgi:hypothetical protein
LAILDKNWRLSPRPRPGVKVRNTNLATLG